MVEGDARNYAKLERNIKPFVDGGGVVAVNALVGIKKGTFAKIVDETGWWDGTEARLVPCSSSPETPSKTPSALPSTDPDCQELRTAPDLLDSAGAPKTFTVLSMDLEMRDVFYDRIIMQIVERGYRPIYVVVELNPLWPKDVFESLGYVSLGRWHYDEVFYWKEGRSGE